MNRAIALANLRPVAESFSWSQVREVLARMEAGLHFGKLVLTVG
jgi:NADPH:quinone reductase-like Zn-dependent oxidoreductase